MSETELELPTVEDRLRVLMEGGKLDGSSFECLWVKRQGVFLVTDEQDRKLVWSSVLARCRRLYVEPPKLVSFEEAMVHAQNGGKIRFHWPEFTHPHQKCTDWLEVLSGDKFEEMRTQANGSSALFSAHYHLDRWELG